VVFCVFFSLVLKSFVAKYRYLSFESPLLVFSSDNSHIPVTGKQRLVLQHQ